MFHNITRGNISTQCYEPTNRAFTTSNCCYYGMIQQGAFNLGLSTTDETPSGYGVSSKAYGAQPGWRFASGLGSANAKNLLIAWRGFLNAPPTQH